MATQVFLYLKANGNDIAGESPITSLGRGDSIMVRSFQQSVSVPKESATARITGRRSHEPLVFVKEMDKASPLIARALCNNEVVEGTFKFYRPSPDGDGTEQHYFTVLLEEARISAFEPYLEELENPTEAFHPAMEKVAILYHRISWTEETTGATHVDDWKETA